MMDGFHPPRTRNNWIIVLVVWCHTTKPISSYVLADVPAEVALAILNQFINSSSPAASLQPHNSFLAKLAHRRRAPSSITVKTV